MEWRTPRPGPSRGGRAAAAASAPCCCQRALLLAAACCAVGAAGAPQCDGSCAAAAALGGEALPALWEEELDAETDALRMELLQAGASRGRGKNSLGDNERSVDGGPILGDRRRHHGPFDDIEHKPHPTPTPPAEVQGKIICVENEGSFDLSWTMTDTSSGQVSNSSSKYDKGKNNCLTISEALPGCCADGDPIAITVKVEAGAEQIFQNVKYDSQATVMVVFECTGSTMKYDCKLTEGTPTAASGGHILQLH